MQKTQNFKKRLAHNETIIMDGGMGTEILHRGFPTALPLWSAEVLLHHPDVVQHIHEDYIRAGAELIITDTFRTTRRAFAKESIADKAREITLLACNLAQKAVESTQPDHEVYIVGSVAPLEDCYSPQLTPPQKEVEVEQNELIADLKEGGVDFLLLETMITLQETLSGILAAQQQHLPFAVSFCCNEHGELLSGEALQEIIPQIEPHNPLFISVNCISLENASRLVKQLRKITTLPIGVYAQGDGNIHDAQGWQFAEEKDQARDYLLAAKQWREDGAQVIGGCCGTTPSHIQQLSDFFTPIRKAL